MALFGKKETAREEVPVQAVLQLRGEGLSNEEVIEQLKSQGYSLGQIRDAMSQAEVRVAAIAPRATAAREPAVPTELPEFPMPEEEFAPPMPSMPTAGMMPSATASVEEMERILEEIVEEKWKDVMSKFRVLEDFKAKVEERVIQMDKRVSELITRLDNVQNVVAGKVEDYDKTMQDVGVEVRALEKVMQKLVPSMADQVKELKDVVGTLRGSSVRRSLD